MDTKTIDVDKRVDEPWEFINKRRHGKQPFVLVEICVGFGTGEIVLADGPFYGCAKDSSIFVETVQPLLREEERVLADNGYYDQRHDRIICAPSGRSAAMTSDERLLAGEIHSARQIVERVFGRIDNFAWVKGIWRYPLPLLRLAFLVTCQLVNLKNKHMPIDHNLQVSSA